MANEPLEETRPTNDAYTGMLAISLLALLAGCALLYLDYSQYDPKTPPTSIPKALPQQPPGGGGVPPGEPAGKPPVPAK